MDDGIVNVLKPPGMTSGDVVYWLRRVLKTKKIGHTGTLDPDAAGVLPICVGRATRLAEYLTGQGKGYRVEITFGLTTTTQDGSGEIVEAGDASQITPEKLKRVLPQYIGKIRQTPPLYSAVRVGGKRLYEYARAGDKVTPEAREIVIHDIKMIDWRNGEKPRAMLDVYCSKGTYIRTLCHDLGQTLGCGAYMSFLLRFKSGRFNLEDSFTLEEIEEQITEGRKDFLLPINSGLDLPVIELPVSRKKAFVNGLSTALRLKNIVLNEGDHVQVYSEGNLLGIGIWKKGEIYPHKVL